MPRPTDHRTGNGIAERIDFLRAKLGSRVAILGHHYQRADVIRHTDRRGDSLELARIVPDIASGHIIFCGVHFMAESAALLARAGQTVHLPAPDADCSMARMATASAMERILTRLWETRRVIPLAYVNSSLAVKAVAGRFGGAVCTSANAGRMLRWALDQGDAVLFLPDRHLGSNTASAIGIPPEECGVISIRSGGEVLDTAALAGKKLLLWPGCCAIHARFNTGQIARLRAEHPGVRVIAHPECPPAVIAAADASGSTSFLIEYVETAPFDCAIAVATESNLVKRLIAANTRRRTILPLAWSECPGMARTGPAQLLAVLEAIDAGIPANAPCTRANTVGVNAAIAGDARKTLERMLDACR